MLTTARNLKRRARASLFNGSNRTEFAWKSIQNNGIFDIITNGMKCFMLIVTILWLCLKLKSGHVHQETSLNGIIINSNLASLPENLCCIWTATRDSRQRKLNYPRNHRYGLELQTKRKLLHVILCILLAGDVATNPGPRSSIECLYLNSRSLKAFVEMDDKPSKVCKIDVFQQLVYSGDYDVVCVCETWLNDSVLDSELLAGYSIFRRDRLGRTGGGVLVAVKDTIRTKRRYDLERNNVEFVVVELFQENMKSILLYTFYRPPNSSLDSIQQLNSSLDDNPESTCVLLTGDFNLPAIDWSLDHPSPTSAGGHLEDKFCELVGDYYLEQLISGPTHRDGNKLDLLLCNYPEIIYLFIYLFSFALTKNVHNTSTTIHIHET